MTDQLRQRPGDQPLPPPSSAPGAHDQLIAQLAERKSLGLSRYGSTLQPHTGRDTGQDLVEELLDAAVYARTLRTELADLETALLHLVTAWAMEPGEAKVDALRQAMDAAGVLLAMRGVPF